MINIGDLVTCRARGEKIGIIVDKRAPNEGLCISTHTKHLVNVYPSVYYVYFYDEGKVGPFYETEVKLKQAILEGYSER
jgi:hypothetical protein